MTLILKTLLVATVLWHAAAAATCVERRPGRLHAYLCDTAECLWQGKNNETASCTDCASNAVPVKTGDVGSCARVCDNARYMIGCVDGQITCAKGTAGKADPNADTLRLTCGECLSGYFLTLSGQCDRCLYWASEEVKANCRESTRSMDCDADGRNVRCVACKPGFEPDAATGGCKTIDCADAEVTVNTGDRCHCADGYAQNPSDKSKCVCTAGFYQPSGAGGKLDTCVPCTAITNCAEGRLQCTTDADQTCQACGHSSTAWTPSSDGKSCECVAANTQGDGCCSPGNYVADDLTCDRCTDIDNCGYGQLTCTTGSDSACAACKGNSFVRSADGTSCSCPVGWYFDNFYDTCSNPNECKTADTTCASCKQWAGESVCASCVDGYTLDFFSETCKKTGGNDAARPTTAASTAAVACAAGAVLFAAVLAA